MIRLFFLTTIFLAGLYGPVHAQELFSTLDDAVKALQMAVNAQDKSQLNEIFGEGFKGLLTGDEVLDQNNERKFANLLATGYVLLKDGDDKVTVEVGADHWPMPVPLVKADGKWYFDTEAGKDEIINRHIGKDELYAIAVCRAYVAAQWKYASMNAPANGKVGEVFAQRFKSTPGKKDGLYWPEAPGEAASPFGPLVAEAHAEGYKHHKGEGPHPFHGYYFRIMTRQGKNAPGGKINYMQHGKLTDGFALVAYPVNWGSSGIMTFIVNQDAKVFEQNLGKKTIHIAEIMKEYDPDKKWTLVTDDGPANAVLEK